MTLAPDMDSGLARDSARRARRAAKRAARGDAGLLLGEDWVRPPSADEGELSARRERRSVIALRSSPLARKIIVFNLLALMVLVAGVLYLNPFRDGLVDERGAALTAQAELIADVLGNAPAMVNAVTGAPVSGPGLGPEARAAFERLSLRQGVEVFLFDGAGQLLGTRTGTVPAPAALDPLDAPRSTVITDFLNGVWEGVSGLFALRHEPGAGSSHDAMASRLANAALMGETRLELARDDGGSTVFTVVTPVRQTLAASAGEAPVMQIVGAVALTSAAGEIDQLVRNEREQVLQVFVLALLVSIGLSLVLASTIANPISDLAAAAELGRERNARSLAPSRVRIPDLAARPDEIGRLSVAMRGMVAALYDRIEMNEQFAADVSHEIKNPLASLRSAVGTLRVARREDQREKLLEVIEHDVRRLDRLVSDISNASRLDSDLVKEQEESFDLLSMLRNLSDFMGREAEAKGIDFITDLPSGPIMLNGLEGRLAQVFVNLLTNAISFCEDGDAVRIWARRRDNRVLVVVEDTGPGIPESALTKIFKRFYSERPVAQFGNHSGLGLAISKQIVEAHGGVIWAENIRPTDADPGSDPLGARFVVGLPV
jgi:two-component system sensor histidine kinase ChvG